MTEYVGSNARLDLLRDLARKANNKQIFVVRASGCVVSGSSNRWFRNSVDLKSGNTIVVSLGTERMPALPLWQVVTQIVCNVAIATGCVESS